MRPTIAIAIGRFIALLTRFKFLTTWVWLAGQFTFALGEFFYLHKNSISYFNFNIKRVDFIEELWLITAASSRTVRASSASSGVRREARASRFK